MEKLPSLHLSRRGLIGAIGTLAFAAVARPSFAAGSVISFDELYGKFGVLGLEFSDKVKRLAGQEISMSGKKCFAIGQPSGPSLKSKPQRAKTIAVSSENQPPKARPAMTSLG